MENKSNSIAPQAMTYGLYMGLAMIFNSVVFYVMGSPFAPVCGYISYAVIIAGITLSMRTYRDNNADGGVTYGRLLGLETLQSLFASLIIAFFTFVLFKLVDKTLLDKFFVYFEEQLLKSGTNENQVETILSLYKKSLTPLTYSLGQIFSITFWGFILSLILAIFFKKKSTDPFYGVE